MDEKQKCGPKRHVLGFFCDGPVKNQANKEPGTEVQQQIQQMITERVRSIERPIKKEGRI